MVDDLFNREYQNNSRINYRKDSPISKEDWLDIEVSEPVTSEELSYEDEQRFDHLERMATRLIGNTQQTVDTPATLPFLGSIVPGAEGCALFHADIGMQQPVPIATANLPREFIHAMSNGDGQRLLATAAKREEPYLIINLPHNRQFAYLNKLTQTEGFRTLWLIPWRGEDGELSGALLFVARQALSPARETVITVTLLAAWISELLDQTNGLRYGYGSSNQACITDDPRIAAVDRIVRNLTGHHHGRLGEAEDEHISRLLIGGNDTSTTAYPRVYQDQHGLPVTYNAANEEKKTKSDGLSILWHELLSPLTVIKGYTSTLLQLNDDITENQKSQYIQGIESASNRMIRLLENLRDVTRLEEADSLTIQRVSMLDLLRTIISEMQSQTVNHIIKIRPSARIPLTSADPEKIEQVVTNLVTNAVKYSPQGGDIEAEVRMVQNERELRSMFGDTHPLRLPCIIVSISDSGIGVPESELYRIFERFYRVNTKLHRTTPGAGLGLYICKIIVEAHGGCIWAKNRLQGGSIFSFSLPLR